MVGAAAVRRDGPLVVPDTNVFISAAIAGGNPEEVLRLGRRRRIRLVTSDAIVRELTSVLRGKFHYTGEELRAVSEDLEAHALWVTPTRPVRLLLGAAESDNRILEAASAASADVVVSGDRDLLDLKTFENIPILKPREFLERHGFADSAP